MNIKPGDFVKGVPNNGECIAMRNSILGFANQFHRVDECGISSNQKTGSKEC